MSSISDVSTGGLSGASGNTPLSNFGGPPGSALSDALNRLGDRLPKSLKLGKARQADKLEQLHLGFDTVEWTAPIDEDVLESLCAELEYLAGAGEPVDFDGVEVVVKRIGGPSHKWRICTSLGFEVRVPLKSCFRLRVLAGPKYVLSQETEDLELRAALLLFKLCNLPDVPPLLLSRVDVALDVLMSVDRFEKMIERVARRDASVVRRARMLTPRLEGDKYRSLQVGKSDVVLRVYDKHAEATKSGDWSFWSQIYGAFEMPEGSTVVRFEYQQRSGFLRQEKAEGSGEDIETALFSEGIETLAQYRAAAPAVLLYLSQAWFRFAGRPKGAGNVRTTLGWWQAVSDLFVMGDWYTYVVEVWRECKRVASKNLERLTQMTAGCLSAVAAILSYRRPEDNKVGVRDVLDYLFEHLMSDDGEGRDRYESWIAGRDRRFKSIKFGVPL